MEIIEKTQSDHVESTATADAPVQVFILPGPQIAFNVYEGVPQPTECEVFKEGEVEFSWLPDFIFNAQFQNDLFGGTLEGGPEPTCVIGLVGEAGVGQYPYTCTLTYVGPGSPEHEAEPAPSPPTIIVKNPTPDPPKDTEKTARLS